MRHSSTMVVGEKLGAKSTPSAELLSPSSTVSRSTVSNWSYSARAKTSLAPGSMPKKTSAVRPFLLELGVEGDLFVDVGRAHDVARAGGRHVEVVRAGLEAGGHDVGVVLGDQRVEAQVDAGQRVNQRLLVGGVELQRLDLARRQLGGHLGQPRLVDVGQHDAAHVGVGGHGARRHLAHRTDTQLQDPHAHHPFPPRRPERDANLFEGTVESCSMPSAPAAPIVEILPAFAANRQKESLLKLVHSSTLYLLVVDQSRTAG